MSGKKLDVQNIVDKLHEHAVLLGESKESTAKYRATSYERAANKLAAELSGAITVGDLDGVDLSDHMKSQIGKLIKGQDLRKPKMASKASKASKSRAKSPRAKSPRAKSPRSKSPSKSPANPKLLAELTKFMGIGSEKANALIEAGLRNINQLHMKKYKDLLPIETKTFLDLKPKQQIPYEHAEQLEPLINKINSPDLRLHMVGSYRREKPVLSDIDIMVVSDNPDAIEVFLKKLSELCKVYPYSKGKDKMSLIVDLSDIIGEPELVYKIDAFRTAIADEIPMLLYSTGSKEFNISMRGKAKKMGYLLNQKGLFDADGNLVPNLNSEEDYFKILNMPYKKPVDRI